MKKSVHSVHAMNPAGEEWFPGLVKTLNNVPLIFPAKFNNFGEKEKKVLEQAIQEICRGVQFCIMKKLDLSVAAQDDFHMSGSSHCILALNSPTRNYFRAAESLGLSLQESGTLGLSCSSEIRTLLMESKLIWSQVYNILWYSVATFFHEHYRSGKS